MRARIMKIQKQDSKYGGNFFFIFLKTFEDTPRSFRTCIVENNANFARWREAIARHIQGKEVILDNLRTKQIFPLKRKPYEVIDADSEFYLNPAP